jgi:concanavalin A-like lectin/glucanase superfamily protein
MASILVVVGDAAVPTTGDDILKGYLQALGHTVTYRSDETAESPTSGYGGIVVAESVAGATIGAKYTSVAIPLVSHEPAHLDALGFTSATPSSLAAQTQIIWLASTPIADGPFGTLSGTDTIFSTGSSLGYFNSADKAAGVTSLARTAGSATEITCASVNTGATLYTGAGAPATAPAKRAYIWPQGASTANLTADGTTAIKNAYAWAFGVATGGSYSTEVLADSPRVYYKMDEGSGQPQDSSGNVRHTTVTTGTPGYGLVGRVGTAIYLHGFGGVTGDSFSTPDSTGLDLGDVFSLECWVMHTAVGVLEMILSKGANAYSLAFNTDNTVIMNKSGVAIVLTSSTTITNDGLFHHIVATKNGATSADAKIYIDGVDRTGSFSNQTFADNAHTLQLGAEDTSYYLQGVLDEVAVYPTALSAARVLAHYNAGIGFVAGANVSQRMMLTGVG